IVGRLKPFGWRDHLLGTDELGRDMLSRILYGGRVSLLMGVVPVLIASLIGGLLGIIGGFVGGRVNTAIMRTMDVFYAFPSVLLASGLSFLGLGVRPPVPDWGLMLSTLRQSIYVVPFVCALPGAAIFVTSMCFNLVSDGLRAAMDVRM